MWHSEGVSSIPPLLPIATPALIARMRAPSVAEGKVPLVLHLVPAVGRVVVLGVPVPWVILTVVAFIEIVLLGIFYVRRAERNEAAFSDLLDNR